MRKCAALHPSSVRGRGGCRRVVIIREDNPKSPLGFKTDVHSALAGV